MKKLFQTLLPLFILSLLAGCASAPIDAFRSFQSSVREAQSGLAAEVGRDADWTREAEVQFVADDKSTALSAYLVRPSSGGWVMDAPPAYWVQRRTARSLKLVNEAFAGYATLLADAVAGGVVDPSTFDDVAGRLNQGFRDLSAVRTGKEDVRGAAAQSAGLSELLRVYLERRRLADLRGAIVETQPWVEAYAARCGELARLTRADLKASYADQAASIQERWTDKRAPGRAGLTRSLFNLNEEYVDALEALAALEEFYARLPAAHRELGDALGRAARGRRALQSLADAAARAASLTRKLEKVK